MTKLALNHTRCVNRDSFYSAQIYSAHIFDLLTFFAEGRRFQSAGPIPSELEKGPG